MIHPDEIETAGGHVRTTDAVDVAEAPHQRSARTDSEMRDGDSGHGNPNETRTEEINSSDTDVGDTAPTGTADADAAEMREHDPEEEAGLAHTRAEFGGSSSGTHLAPEPSTPAEAPRTID